DISAALALAHAIYDDVAAKQDLGKWDMANAVSLIEHATLVERFRAKNGTIGRVAPEVEKVQEHTIPMPNVRVLIYSDGQHNASDRLDNPFASLQPSILMTAFLGNPDASDDARLGADQMKSLATICPAHGFQGYFLIDAPWRFVRLRGLFRINSSSGF